MSRRTKGTPGGRAYRDLRNRARREGRPTEELLVLYTLERWLARLAGSPHAAKFVLKGGMVLAALGARRPTPTSSPRTSPVTSRPWSPS